MAWQVYVCCDYCERYFMDMCEITKDQAFQFCMEKAHCVCNSVTKVRSLPIANPSNTRTLTCAHLSTCPYGSHSTKDSFPSLSQTL